MRDIRQTKEYANFMRNIGWVVERKSGVNYFIKKLPLIGSFIKTQRPEKIDFNQINRIAKKYRAFQIVIEPKNTSDKLQVTGNKFKLSNSPYLPSKTIHINLTKSEKQLLKEMHHKTRYNIRKIKNYKLKIINSKDIQSFADFWQECSLKQRGMFLSQKKEIVELYKAFDKNAYLILVCTKHKLENHPWGGVAPAAHPAGEILSGILMVRTKDVAYYMYAASSDLGKKLFAPTLAAWEAIKLAKKLRCKIFDFEGIYDERFALKSWLGFTRFKKSFGGEEIEYPGAFTKFLLPFK